MAAELLPVDLKAFAEGCPVPYSTLARWAKQREWTVLRKIGKRRLYSFDQVAAAVMAREDAA